MIKVTAHSSHRNGVCGAGFYIALFTDTDCPDNKFLGIQFQDGDVHTAVVDVNQAANGDIAFGSNSWRGDRYHDALEKSSEALRKETLRD